jgi:lipid-A-disaccharide synthase
MAAANAPRLALVAGEASGDLLAALLLGGLSQRWSGLESFGIGGPKMVARGFTTWWPHDKLAVRGYVEVLRHYREIARIRDRLAERLLEHPPDAFIGVDAPDFNLGLEQRLRSSGIKTIHFVCPSIWAWRGRRVKQIARAADLVLCLFPFEPELLQRHGIASTYVGHPLADEIPIEPPHAAARAALGLSPSSTVVALLPGSRRSEIEYIAPLFLQAAARLARARGDLQFVLPRAPGLGELIDPLADRFAADVPLKRVDGRSHEVLAACNVALIASGTATLEAALFKRPMVIGYRMNALTWQLMKRMRYQPWVGLPNILCRDFVVPEAIQEQATPERLSAEVLAWLDAPARVAALQQRLVELHHQLRQDTSRKATDAIAQILAS